MPFVHRMRTLPVFFGLFFLVFSVKRVSIDGGNCRLDGIQCCCNARQDKHGCTRRIQAMRRGVM